MELNELIKIQNNFWGDDFKIELKLRRKQIDTCGAGWHTLSDS